MKTSRSPARGQAADCKIPVSRATIARQRNAKSKAARAHTKSARWAFVKTIASILISTRKESYAARERGALKGPFAFFLTSVRTSARKTVERHEAQRKREEAREKRKSEKRMLARERERERERGRERE